ncbi:MAG TPA: hypothetical protein PKE64_18010 [Anaerolineae bacterium]|nr:hypothetical protein [Anaerolineae bacterium]HMR65906.1 hypothetical protein [Anaerolineae bacterium]
MIPLTPEQREYKERTLEQLFIHRAELETLLEQEPENPRTLQSRLDDIDAHISRLQDELSGNVIMDEPVAQELLVQAAKALSKEKFHLARRYIDKLATIEPFHPALDRLWQELEAGQVSRRTKSIAQGTATAYPGMDTVNPVLPVSSREGVPPDSFGYDAYEAEAEAPQGIAQFFQFHIVMSCLVVVLLACVMFGTGGVTMLRWLIEG